MPLWNQKDAGMFEQIGQVLGQVVRGNSDFRVLIRPTMLLGG